MSWAPLTLPQRRMLHLVLESSYCHRTRHTWDIRVEVGAQGSVVRVFMLRTGMALLRRGLLKQDIGDRYVPTPLGCCVVAGGSLSRKNSTGTKEQIPVISPEVRQAALVAFRQRIAVPLLDERGHPRGA